MSLLPPSVSNKEKEKEVYLTKQTPSPTNIPTSGLASPQTNAQSAVVVATKKKMPPASSTVTAGAGSSAGSIPVIVISQAGNNGRVYFFGAECKYEVILETVRNLKWKIINEEGSKQEARYTSTVDERCVFDYLVPCC
jgi:hypothetical protein